MQDQGEAEACPDHEEQLVLETTGYRIKNRELLKRPERVKDYGGQMICAKGASDFALIAMEGVSSWDTSLSVPCDGQREHLLSLRVGLSALLVVVQYQQAEEVEVFLTLRAGCLSEEQLPCQLQPKTLADGPGGSGETRPVC